MQLSCKGRILSNDDRPANDVDPEEHPIECQRNNEQV